MTVGTTPVVAGPHVILRPFRPEDIIDSYLGWLNDDEHLRFSTQRGRSHDRASCLAYLEGFAGTPHYFWAVEEPPAGALAGTMTAYDHGTHTDLGILIGASGRGLGSAAWGLALDHLLRIEGRAKVTAGTAREHAAMRRIFERWGMVHEDTLPDGGPGGLAMPMVRYGLTREAWGAGRSDGRR
jgi:RimJ/RimL family protein N-acetyltransferase